MKVTYTLLMEIFKSTDHIDPEIMRKFFNQKVSQHNLRSNLSIEVTCHFKLLILCFGGIYFQTVLASCKLLAGCHPPKKF